MDVYLLVLDGQSDEYAAIVDKETWDWIHSDIPTTANGASSWSEFKIMPARVREALGKEVNDSDEIVDFDITIGSYQNDRALHVCSLPDAALYSDMGDERETKKFAKQWAKKNGHKIIDTFEGYIY